jgi:hypothetical protein
MLGVYAVLAATKLHGSVDAHSLAASVERVVDVGGRIYDDDGYGCKRDRGAWECVVPNSDSGVAGYRVTVQPGTSCWQARIIGTDPEIIGGMPKTASGCVRRRESGF